MTAVFVQGVGLVAPGLLGWRANLDVLRGARAYQAQPLPAFNPALLPANERRRLTPTTKLALQAAQEALEPSAISADHLCSVFASSGGDYEIIDKLCTALLLPERPVSPTHFHNSVHNAAAGYWTIATGCHQPSTSLSAYDWSFSAGLLEAATVAHGEGVPVLLVAYDQPAPFPLSEARPLHAPFATALLLEPEPSPAGFAELRLGLTSQGSEDQLNDPQLERLRTGNPAARSLPLLQAMAGGRAGAVRLPYLSGQQLLIHFAPCP